MLRSAYVTVIYLGFLILGLSAPFVFSLGYVWVDTFSPQKVATEVLPLFPVSLIMAVSAIGGYVMFDRKSPPPLSLNTVVVRLGDDFDLLVGRSSSNGRSEMECRD